MSNFNFKKKHCLLTLVLIIFIAGSFTLNYADSFDEIKERIKEKVDAYGRIILKYVHPSSTYRYTEIADFYPYDNIQIGYVTIQKPYEYNLKVVFRVNYTGWVKRNSMRVAVYLKYLIPKDIRLESDTLGQKAFGLNLTRKIVAKLRLLFD